MMTVLEALIHLAPHIAKLVESLVADDYDQEAEKQALLGINRAMADARMKKALG